MTKMVVGPDAGLRPGVSPAIVPAGACAVPGVAQGALVLTLEGALPVEYLSPGDRVVTRAGARRLLAVTPVEAEGEMVLIQPGVLGHDRPGQALMLGAQTPVLLRDWRAQALYGAAQALVPAGRLVDGEFVTRVCGRGLRLFALHFERPEVIYVDGVEIGTAPLVVPA
ncbi:MAG: Hint domain-containing protein [Paracoccaceae bacterium]|jgi:hypothetical protein